MRRMGLEAIYRKPRTSEPQPGHRISPTFDVGKVPQRWVASA